MSDSSILDNLVVRPVRKEEVSRWNSYMQQYHYLGLRWIGGKSLRYIAHLEGEWVALLGWGSASKNCGARERYIAILDGVGRRNTVDCALLPIIRDF